MNYKSYLLINTDTSSGSTLIKEIPSGRSVWTFTFCSTLKLSVNSTKAFIFSVFNLSIKTFFPSTVISTTAGSILQDIKGDKFEVQLKYFLGFSGLWLP